MDLHACLTQKVAIALTSAALLALHTGGAAAATVHSPMRPNTTQEWGNDVVHVTSADPATVSVSPSGAGIQSSGGDDDMSTARRLPGAKTADTEVTVDYCVEFDVDGNATGPFRVRFHFGSTDDSESAIRAPRHARAARRSLAHGHAVSPLDTGITIPFSIGTTVDTTALTVGDLGLVGAIYDDNDTLVATDDAEGDRISTSLAAGDYTLVLSNDDELLGQSYMLMADQGTCEDD